MIGFEFELSLRRWKDLLWSCSKLMSRSRCVEVKESGRRQERTVCRRDESECCEREFEKKQFLSLETQVFPSESLQRRTFYFDPTFSFMKLLLRLFIHLHILKVFAKNFCEDRKTTRLKLWQNLSRLEENFLAIEHLMSKGFWNCTTSLKTTFNFSQLTNDYLIPVSVKNLISKCAI